MTTDNKSRSLLEHLPTEIFFQIFDFLHFQELATAFSGLNFHIESIIQSVTDISLIVRYDDTNALKFLQLYSDRIKHLSILSVQAADLTSLPNLRSLVLKYGNYNQWDSIRPENMPMLKFLHIHGFFGEDLICSRSKTDLLDTIFSDGFSQLKKCIIYNIGSSKFDSAWRGSSNLRTLNSDMMAIIDIERLRMICPQLNRFATETLGSTFDTEKVYYCNPTYRFFAELRKLKQLKAKNKFIVEVDYWGIIDNKQIPSRFNKSEVTKNNCGNGLEILRGRIFPQTDPYCRASFLIKVLIAPEYPFKPPEIHILDPMYHPFVHESKTHFCWGACGGYFNDVYKPSTSLAEVLEKVINRIDNVSGTDCIVNDVCALEYRQDYDAFYKKALDMTLSYGQPRTLS